MTALWLPDGSLVNPDLAQARHSRLSGATGRPDVTDRRTQSERDRDRIAYSGYLQRLSGVTQVMTPHHEVADLHSRLNHSHKVALVARAIATDLVRRAVEDEVLRDLILAQGGLDVAACEAAGLAHDLGHPPFGHAAEGILDDWLVEGGAADGFEGNAQSLRVVARLDQRHQVEPGMDLTAVTLAAVLKYPYPRPRAGTSSRRHPKFGYYADDVEVFRHSRAALPPGGEPARRSLEAEVMDLADDITYAMHDLQDFYTTGLIDLSRIGEGLAAVEAVMRTPAAATIIRSGSLRVSFEEHLARLKARHAHVGEAEYADALGKVMDWLGYFPETYRGTPLQMATVSRLFARKIGEIVRTVDMTPQPRWPGAPSLTVSRGHWYELEILRHLAKHFVVDTPVIQMHERGQAAALRIALTGLWDWAKEPRGLPQPLYTRLLDADGEPARRRAVVDHVCSLTDHQVLRLARVLSGGELPFMTSM